MGKYNFGKDGPKFEGHNIFPAFASVETTETQGDGSTSAQFVFKDVSGNTVTEPVSGLLYLSESATGLTHDLAEATMAVDTNGALTNIGGKGPSLFTTTAAGLLGIEIDANDDDYYVVFVKPDGSLVISDVLEVSTST